jgi:hypothetical protein
LRNTLEGYLDLVSAMAFSLDSQLLAFALYNNIVRL